MKHSHKRADKMSQTGEIGAPVAQQRQEVVSWQEVMSETVKSAAD